MTGHEPADPEKEEKGRASSFSLRHLGQTPPQQESQLDVGPEPRQRTGSPLGHQQGGPHGSHRLMSPPGGVGREHLGLKAVTGGGRGASGSKLCAWRGTPVRDTWRGTPVRGSAWSKEGSKGRG